MNLNRNSNILIEEMQLKMSSAKFRPSCLGIDVVSGPSVEEGTLQKRLGIAPFQQQGVLTEKAAEYRKF